MRRTTLRNVVNVLLGLLLCVPASLLAESGTLRVATYNLQNYLEMDRLVEGRFRMDYPKREREKSVLRESIREANADVLALQEIGSLEHLVELRKDLAAEGLRYNGAYVLEAEDPVRRVGALWKEGITIEPVPHGDLDYKYFEKRDKVKRGMLELKIHSSSTSEILSVFVLHLKSRYTTDPRDPEAEIRRVSEAQAARNRILEIYPEPSRSRFLILGDLNDQRHTSAIRRFLVRGDTDISEICDARDQSGLIWTHFYKKGGEYSLIDYILISPGFSVSLKRSGILDRADFFEGSDHRLVWADFAWED